ncbi:MarR family winged helix-turn-helix transcriptional regulator [Pseudonocardia sp. TRM90224]|uniref:MarR family winged helix-turn-helix transcriptional regulator n=1 Tax=Pseudonocardia sp. TRM90224 TaxID=2812678 RepID=UPI001E38EFA4|nr:MarR family winged helix-turn-helix transcriptional regulator [Pseudonocardia sp. TRM90224]
MDDRSANLVAAMVVALADALEDATRRAGVHGPSGAAALATIHYVPGCRVDELSKVLGITGSGGVRLVDRLVAAGLVERRPGLDKRSVALWLTGDGSTAAERVVAERREVLRAALAPLDEEEQRALAAVAEPVLTALATDRARADRICRFCDYAACPQDRCPVEVGVS